MKPPPIIGAPLLRVTLFRSVAVGVACAVGLGVLAFALAAFSDAVGVYIAPLALFAPVIDRLVPEAVMSLVIGNWLFRFSRRL
jgi:hypothetical protein